MILSYQDKVLQLTEQRPQTLVLRMKQQVHKAYSGKWYGYSYGDHDYVITITALIKNQSLLTNTKVFIAGIGNNTVRYVDHNDDIWNVDLDINQTNIRQINRGMAEVSLTLIGNKI